MGERNTASGCSRALKPLRSLACTMACQRAREARTAGFSWVRVLIIVVSLGSDRRTSDPGGQGGALVDGALGIEFGGHIGASDQVHAAAGGLQAFVQLALGLLAGADHHV